MPKRRLDTLLTERGLFASRSRAAASVMAGEVRVGGDGQRAEKPGELVDPEVALSVDERPRFVSRGGVKLSNALDAWSGLGVRGRRAIDVGASTGGFTDCLLQRGAREVIAVDVGYGTLDFRLRKDERVQLLERTNARALTAAMLTAPRAAGARDSRAAGGSGDVEALPGGAGGVGLPDLAVIDVSFISLEKVLGPVVGCLDPEHDVLALVKPQFEVGRGRVGKGGVVRDPELRRMALVRVGEAALELGEAVLGYRSSGLPGPKGNRESFIWLAHGGQQLAGRGAGGRGDLERLALEAEPR